MPYVTIAQNPKYKQLTFDDILNDVQEADCILPYDSTSTITRFRIQLPDLMVRNADIPGQIAALQQFNQFYDSLFSVPRKQLYRFFDIKKSNGKKRRISTPDNDGLKNAHVQLQGLLEPRWNSSFRCYHTAGHAFIKGRSTMSAVLKHQRNESVWFAHFDFHDFFGSTTLDFLYNMVSNIFPYSEIVKSSVGAEVLKKALDLCFLDGGLPQGTTISPFLSNLMMIPLDHYISKCLREDKRARYVYTRYADDMIISSQNMFDYKEVQSLIEKTLEKFNAPIFLNEDKTEFRNHKGKNWLLGVMLNCENNITLGYQKKKDLRAHIHNYAMDRKRGEFWCLKDLQKLQGQIAYFRQIEPCYTNEKLDDFSRKYHLNIENYIKKDIRNAVV